MHSTYQGGDPADYPQSSVDFDYDAIDDSIERERQRRIQIPTPGPMENVSVQAALLKMIAFIIDSSDYRRRIDVVVVAVGFPLLLGSSYTELAKKHGVTKQAFDKEVLKFQKDFNLPVTRAQKSPQARLSYQKTQLERQQKLREKNQQLKARKASEVWQSSSEKAAKALSVS